jgi:RNA polymerase sigma-70 factor (ECF subfamily)
VTASNRPPYATAIDMADALRQAQTGDQEGFRLLWVSYQPRVLRYLTARGTPSPEDVASETWFRVAREIRRFTGGPEEFASWLFTVARNQAIDAARYGRRRPVVPVPPEDLPDRAAAGDPAQEVLDRLSTREALALIRSLPPDQADAVALRVIGDLDPSAVARVMGKTPGAVRVATHRGLRTLAAKLTDGAGAVGVTA